MNSKKSGSNVPRQRRTLIFLFMVLLTVGVIYFWPIQSRHLTDEADVVFDDPNSTSNAQKVVRLRRMRAVNIEEDDETYRQRLMTRDSQSIASHIRNAEARRKESIPLSNDDAYFTRKEELQTAINELGLRQKTNRPPEGQRALINVARKELADLEEDRP